MQEGQTLFGKYEIVRKLGQGGMGTVWLVRHRESQALRALKTVALRQNQTTQAIQRFQREMGILASAWEHPQAVTMHDARVEDGVAYVDMEFVDGQSLRERLKPGCRLPLKETALIIKQLCSVLQAAHEIKIIHGNLKPTKLMIVDNDQPGKVDLKVLDFAIAKLLGGCSTDENGLRTQSFLGAPAYASPEQIDGGENRLGTLDHRSDLYSVGLILYEMLTGYRPFSSEGIKLLHDHSRTPPPTFAMRNPDLPPLPHLERLTLRCLCKNPSERPQSARQLGESFIEALKKDTATLASGDSPPTRVITPNKAAFASGSWLRGKGDWSGPSLWSVVGGASALAAALAVGFAAFVWLGSNSKDVGNGDHSKASRTESLRPKLSGGRAYPPSAQGLNNNDRAERAKDRITNQPSGEDRHENDEPADPGQSREDNRFGETATTPTSSSDKPDPNPNAKLDLNPELDEGA